MQARLNPHMETFANRVRTLREQLGLTQTELANLCGLKQPDISKIELGRIQQTIEILGLSRALGVSPDWLATGNGPKYTNNLIPLLQGKQATPLEERAHGAISLIDLDNNPEYPSVRRVAIKAQAGVTGYAVEYMNDDGPPIVFRRDWYASNNFRPEKMLAMRIAGESMIPNLQPGDLIVINTESATPKDGVAFVVAYEGEITAKRMVRDDGLWWLSSDNADQRRYPRKKCNGDTQIIGEVIYRQTSHI